MSNLDDDEKKTKYNSIQDVTSRLGLPFILSALEFSSSSASASSFHYFFLFFFFVFNLNLNPPLSLPKHAQFPSSPHTCYLRTRKCARGKILLTHKLLGFRIFERWDIRQFIIQISAGIQASNSPQVLKEIETHLKHRLFFMLSFYFIL